MSEELDTVLALKASAKDARADGDWESAVGDLGEAIAILNRLARHASTRVGSHVDSELADCHGMIGGIQKGWALASDSKDREEHLRASLVAYDQGFEYERKGDILDAPTYNRINRLSARVLLDAAALIGTSADGVDVRMELFKAEDLLVEQLASVRQRDPWGYCDVAVVRLLLGEPDALQTLREIERLRPPTFVYESTLATLRPLSNVAASLRPDLNVAIQELERLLQQSAR